MESAAHVESGTVEVKATFPSASKPFQKEYPAQAILGTVKADILTFFELKEETVAGQAIRFTLHLGPEELTNLSATVGSLVHHPHEKIVLHVVKDLTFGGASWIPKRP